MKYKFFLYPIIPVLCICSCSKDGITAEPFPDSEMSEIATAPAVKTGRVYHAGFASQGSETKVYIDDNVKMHWDADDQVSIFAGTTSNMHYRFNGETGARTGDFVPVTDTDGDVSGSPTEGNKIYSVYPYNPATTLATNGALSVQMPGTQSYREKSFGLGANTMVCISDDEALYFHNACGYLVLKFYGSGNVSSVSVKGNNNEIIAGTANVTFNGENPSIAMGTGTDSVTLLCEDPVVLNDQSTPKEFWFTLPPVIFSGGFTITVTGSNNVVKEISSSRQFTVSRNSVLRISALEVNLMPQNQIEDGEEVDGGNY